MPDTYHTLKDMTAGAVKLDSGKTRWDLLPWDAVEQLAVLYTKGAQKYADRNWEKGFRWGRTYAAMLRHASTWFLCKVRGTSDIDPETGLSHMVAVVWNALALVTFELRRVGEDDRPTRIPIAAAGAANGAADSAADGATAVVPAAVAAPDDTPWQIMIVPTRYGERVIVQGDPPEDVIGSLRAKYQPPRSGITTTAALPVEQVHPDAPASAWVDLRPPYPPSQCAQVSPARLSGDHHG